MSELEEMVSEVSNESDTAAVALTSARIMNHQAEAV